MKKKITTTQLKQMISEGVQKLHKLETLKEEKKRIEEQINMMEMGGEPDWRRTLNSYVQQSRYESESYNDFKAMIPSLFNLIGDDDDIDSIADALRFEIKLTHGEEALEVATPIIHNVLSDHAFDSIPEEEIMRARQNIWSQKAERENQKRRDDDNLPFEEQANINEMDEDEFVAHGSYAMSNAGGYEIMLSDSGDAARVRDAYGSDNPKTSDWLEIEHVPSEDGELDDEGYPEMEAVIDPSGYNIPLSQVMRISEGLSEMENTADYSGEVRDDYDLAFQVEKEFGKEGLNFYDTITYQEGPRSDFGVLHNAIETFSKNPNLSVEMVSNVLSMVLKIK